MTDDSGHVQQIQVKQRDAASNWIWGAFKMPGATLRELLKLWNQRGRSDEYMGTPINAHIARGGQALGVRAGDSYVDIGTPHGYRAAITLLSSMTHAKTPGIQIAHSGEVSSPKLHIQNFAALWLLFFGISWEPAIGSLELFHSI